MVGTAEWFALRVRSNSEKLAAIHLEARGFQPFVPMYRSRRSWSDRLKEIDLPLFPGYVFCQFVITNRFPIVSAPGVVYIVGTGKVPVAVDPTEIAAIQAITASGLPTQPWPFLRIGQIVRVERGSLRGLEGILTDVRKKHRLVVSLTLLQRSAAVEVDRDWVCPIFDRETTKVRSVAAGSM